MRDFKVIMFMGSCNLACWYCNKPVNKVAEQAVIRSMDQILGKFIRQDTSFRVECRGEITLYKTVVQYLHNKALEGYRVEILTNGLKLGEVLPVNSPIHVNISLDGHTANMNRYRNLSQKQVDLILDNIFKYNADIQMVYLTQSVLKINQFIQYLDDRGFNQSEIRQRLHIFPCSIQGKLISTRFPYEQVLHKEFIPGEEYFRRMNYIIKHGRRDFVCDFRNNGYVYYIYNNEVKSMKCDGNPEMQHLLHPVDQLEEDSLFECGSCINHSEYNNSREFLYGL